MDYIEKTAATVEEAIQEGLRELGISRDQAKIEIVEESTKGFLGIGKKPAKVKITPSFDPIKVVTDFLKELTISMNIIADIKVNKTGKNLVVNLSGENMGILIGKRGQTLDALQHIAGLVVNKGVAPYVNVILDTESYRERRKLSLENLSYSIARRVKNTRKTVTLEPMPSNERRIIHFALEHDKGVITKSVGAEPYRHVIVEPAK
jgi:spoIIIJ-associated protein